MKIFALVDCNNFYASCERVFDPSLKKRAIVILSNNDGCIIARSNEAKALGIPMGAPFFQQKAIIKKHNVAVFSSNYQLYGDMSQRIMDTLRLHAPHMEIYSIDEAFLRLDPLQPHDLYEYCKTIRAKVLQWTGVPVSIGIGPTKVLAKVANHVAKKQTGVFNICSQQAQDEILKTIDVGKIWGIARRWSERLNQIGINKASELRDASPTIIRKHLSVVGERILRELKGQACIDLESIQPRKTIMSSKSFGNLITNKRPIEEALANYTARACEKLREQNSRAQAVYVFIQTNGFRETGRQYNNGLTYTLTTPTSDTRLIIKAAKLCLSRIYKQGYRYKKTGVMLTGLIPTSLEQKQLFVDFNHHASDHLMDIVDRINKSYGPDTLFLGAQGVTQEWKMRCVLRSQRYTTQWDELVTVS